MDGGESVKGWRLLGCMMLQRKKSSKSNSKRCSFGDKGGTEGGYWVRSFGLGREIAKILVSRTWRYSLAIQIRRKIRGCSCGRHDG